MSPRTARAAKASGAREPVNEVVDRHRPGVQLSLRDITAAAVEQREVWAHSENDDLPVARVGDREGDDSC